MLQFLIKRNLSTLSTVMVLLWIFILPFLESWWYIFQIIQGNYAYAPDCAFFLCGNSVGIGHIFQGLYLWLLPLYCLVISSNDCLMDQERGYDNILISRIGKRKMIYGLLIKNFILLSLLVFLSLSLNLFCVHLMFRGGKYNPSEISALNVFTMFWTNHRAYSDHMYYLWHYGYVLLCNILLFPQPKNGIFCKYIFLAD